MFSRWHLSFFQEQNIPLWHSLGAKGCKGDLPSGGNAAPEKGLFRGMLGIATTEFLGQESDLLTIRAAPAKHPVTTVCQSMQWPFGHSFEGGAKPL